MPQVHRKPYLKRAAALVVACILFCLAPMAAAATERARRDFFIMMFIS